MRYSPRNCPSAGRNQSREMAFDLLPSLSHLGRSRARPGCEPSREAWACCPLESVSPGRGGRPHGFGGCCQPGHSSDVTGDGDAVLTAQLDPGDVPTHLDRRKIKAWTAIPRQEEYGAQGLSI